MRRYVASAPAPQAAAFVATLRAKSDRKIMIVLGATNPRLSGFRRTRPAARKRAKGSLAWGVELGPAGGPRTGPRGGHRHRSNVYGGIGRRSYTSGYVFGSHMDEIGDAVAPAYMDALARAVEKAHDLQSLRRRGMY